MSGIFRSYRMSTCLPAQRRRPSMNFVSPCHHTHNQFDPNAMLEFGNPKNPLSPPHNDSLGASEASLVLVSNLPTHRHRWCGLLGPARRWRWWGFLADGDAGGGVCSAKAAVTGGGARAPVRRVAAASVVTVMIRKDIHRGRPAASGGTQLAAKGADIHLWRRSLSEWRRCSRSRTGQVCAEVAFVLVCVAPRNTWPGGYVWPVGCLAVYTDARLRADGCACVVRGEVVRLFVFVDIAVCPAERQP